MKIQPTGSVEQLYSPSYGSRASSSLSLNSSGNRSDLNVHFHSSLPVVYYSSQERLGNKSTNGRRIPRQKWSSHDRLLSPILSADLEVLAAKGQRQLFAESATHHHYHSHLYTPKRTRKTDPSSPISVERSASFNSTGFYRSSSDGVRKEGGARLEQPPVAMVDLSLDDMPALPPQTTRDVIATPSPDVSLNVSLPGKEEASSPPHLPLGESPLFTPQAKDDSSSQSTDSPPSDATFDYNDLSPPVGHSKTASDDEFDFSLPESSEAPPPPPISSLPPDEQTPPTTPLSSPPYDQAPPTPLSSPPYDQAPPTPLSSPPYDQAPPTPLSSPPYDEAPQTIEAVVLSGAAQREESSMELQLERHITPRTALAKALEDFDQIGSLKLADDEESEGGGVEGESNELNHVYAAVDKSKKRKREISSVDGERDGSLPEEGTVEAAGGGSGRHLYAKVDTSKKQRKQQSPEKDKNGVSSELTPFKSELVHKAASVEDIVGPDYAEVSHPKRSSLPPTSSPAQSPTHEEPGYATIGEVSPPPSTQPPHPSPQGKLYEVSSSDGLGRGNQGSIRKLGIMFGPEFRSLSGIQTLNKPSSIKVGVAYSFIVAVVMFMSLTEARRE